ncbi:plasmid recombination protein [Ruegeria arenilitoris]|uniref:plasmid recombination protein n=1 Tax=Ruegeria arenilitoris TaxID=1173585 RepID=UPI00147C76C9|nr:plasmid recombination protein [Ruegeria arenilitoris]
MDFPVVLRFQSMHPNDLGKFEMHGNRTGGDLSHVDKTKTAQNQVYVGSETWIEDLREEIEEAKRMNFENEIAALEAKKRKKDVARRKEEGLKDPWKHSNGGPLREVILSANAEFFKDPVKAAMFEREGPAFFDHFFRGQVRCLRLDRDEQAPHFHAIIVPWTEKTSARRGTQKLIEPSSHPLLKAYENAQDAAGDWFEGIGLKRGKEKSNRKHKAPADYRKEVSEAYERGIEALEENEVKLSSNGEKIVFGESGPKDKQGQKQLAKEISPAYPKLMKIAKSIQKMKNDAMKVIKEKTKKLLEFEKLLTQKESELDKREKDLDRQARIIAAARKQNGKPDIPELQRIIMENALKKMDGRER